MQSIFDSASALQRFRNRHNLQLSSPNHASSYILTCKIKRALKDLTEDIFHEYLQECGFVPNSQVTVNEKINQWLIKLEKLEAVNMKIIYEEYQDNGIRGLIRILSLPLAKLNRLTTERRKHEEEAMY